MIQEEPGGAKQSQKEPEGAKRIPGSKRNQKEPGGDTRCQEVKCGARRSQEKPGEARRSQEGPSAPSACQHNSWRDQFVFDLRIPWEWKQGIAHPGIRDGSGTAQSSQSSNLCLKVPGMARAAPWERSGPR
jgi:hypothetical protein